jgi:microcystin-dependent protein
MSNYTKATNFTAKDTLPTGNSGKIVKGTEIDTELTAVASAISSKADLNSPALTGTPTAPTASAATNTTQVATTAFVQTALSGAFSTGMIMMWSGTIATIPTGWVLCNGSNSTPDLRNRFIIGAHSDTAGVAYSTVTGSNTQTGGTKDAIVVSHTHTATTTATDSGHSHTIKDGEVNTRTNPYFNWVGTGGASVGVNGASTNSSTANITASTSISTEGSSGTNQNLPPYYALAFIMKT